MKALSLHNLTVFIGDRKLVNNVSFDIKKGEILALVGESGSGKTLTALSIMDLLPQGLVASGQWSVAGKENLRITGHKSQITCLRGKDAGMIFQEPMTSLNPLHTIGRQISEAIEVYNDLSKAELHARVVELLEGVGLGSFKDRLDAYPHQLSGGERQRVMIAIAIANNPVLLIADEPTTALDVTIQAQILNLLRSLRKRLGMSVLLITHDLTIVRKVADRIAIMTQGSIVEMGNTQEIFANPKHPYTRHLLSSEPKSRPYPVAGGALVIMKCRDLAVEFEKSRKLLAWKKSYKSVLSGINLSVQEGTTLGVVGESGSGKTTLALALLRLVKSSGEIIFDGERIDKISGDALRYKRRDMQIVFQDPYSSLNPRMYIGEIIREGLDVHEKNLSLKERENKVDSILLEVGLSPEMKYRYPHEFSGGQRQRISIARALVLRPKLIILDEPTSALDLSVQAQILDLLSALQQKYGLSYLFISHDLRVVRAISHTIVVLQQGRIVESGSADQIFSHPEEDYTRALLAAAF